nr:PREDICTED: tenomodulin-like [Latimeria chalumnae]|eukprot:XP_006012179.1 PREDICTED: tenomodulin-like [Latimeria chalumnae]
MQNDEFDTYLMQTWEKGYVDDKGITGIFIARQQKCYIKPQTKVIPEISVLQKEVFEGEEEEIVTTYLEESSVWIQAEEPVENLAFLQNSRILEICETVPVYWIHPAYGKNAEFHDFEDGEESEESPVANTGSSPDQSSQPRADFKDASNHKRQTRDIEYTPIHDYSENEIVLDPQYDERGFCCAYCRRGVRYCQRYCEQLLGYMPYPYCYQGGRVICRIVMPCNWWVARILGRV